MQKKRHKPVVAKWPH